jgi:hypothetical protein
MEKTSSIKKDKFVHESVVKGLRAISYQKKQREQIKPNYRRGFTEYRQTLDPMSFLSEIESVDYTAESARLYATEEDSRYAAFSFPANV